MEHVIINTNNRTNLNYMRLCHQYNLGIQRKYNYRLIIAYQSFVGYACGITKYIAPNDNFQAKF